ncbi:MAG: methyltransferase domain-containing protein [Deltaproteobacteria bacterium]|nr:MAG: methyltransferase domain-containing protein [Deltaproteobacteria bacterium]
MTPPESACLVCGSADLLRFLDLPRVPVYCNVLLPTAAAARKVARGDLTLAICRKCGHVFNTAFDPKSVDYSDRYENSLHYSPLFRGYAEALARELVERHGLRGRRIVEIASGQGDFLRLLCRLGGNEGVGFDPSYRDAPPRDLLPAGEDNRAGEGDGTVRFVKTYYGAGIEKVAADFLCCRQALEHVPDPVKFLTGLRVALSLSVPPGSPKQRTTLFFEVPNSLFSLRDGGIWDFIYEHVSYFCGRSLKGCFTRAGFTVQRTWESFGGQFLCLEATWPATRETAGIFAEVPPQERLVEYATGLGDTVRTLVDQWRERLGQLRREGQRAAIWGAGSKGVTFLNLLNAGDEISYVVDINPEKHGMFTAGTGHAVISPDEITNAPPDLVVCVNPQYREENTGMLAVRSLEIPVVAV